MILQLLSNSELSLTRAKDGGIPEIEDAKSYLQTAAKVCPLSHPDHFRVMALLARAHFAAFGRAGTIAYLKESVAHYSKATDLCPKTHPLRSSVLIGYSEVLLKNFKDWGQRRDLDKVFDLLAEALPLCLSGSEDHAQTLHNLGVAHAVIFAQDGHVDDLEKSASYHKSVLEIRTSSHPDRPLSLYSLAETYTKLFENSGDLAKLDTAIQYCHEALSLSPPQRPEDSLFLAQLGSACLQRYTARGDVEDLDRSIKFQREALQLQREGLTHRFAALGNLGRALSTRFELRRDIVDAEESVKCLQQALMFYPRGHPERPLVFSDRGRALLNRYSLRGDMEDLTNSIRDFGEALTLCGEGHPWHGQFLYNLADALLIRFDKTRTPRDQKSAQRYLESGRLVLHQDDPTMGLILFASAREHLLRAAGQPEIWPNLVDEAFLLYEKASAHPTLGARQQLAAALSWVAAAEERKHPSSLAAYKQTFVLLDKQLNVVSDVLTRHLIRKQLPTNLATNAAACAIDEGENDVATELLEQGRGLLWMQLTRLRTPIEDLRKLGPEGAALADRFEQLSKALEAGATTISEATSSEGAEASKERNAQRYREMSERWEETLAEIRRVPGFTHFLQATPYSNLQDAASAGPVIMFNIGQRRSDALIISEVGVPNVIPLPQATPRTLASLSSDLANTLRTTRAVEDEKYRTSQVTRVLRQLWDIVISPVVQCLSPTVKPGSRIWLCPTAELCSLPIHAAGQYRKGGSNLPDLFVCSYTPTLSALIRARQNHSGSREVRPAVLTIGERNEEARGGEATLVSASSELEGVGKLVPANIPHHELLDSAATPEGVLRGLQDHTWVHIACHGVQEPSQPFYSHFLLHHKPLRLLDIIQANLDHVKFAFTSACHTAVGDKNTPDEVISLAAALQFAGFRSVVGTTWGMDDRDGPDVTKTFYKFMFDAARNMDHTEAAIALSAATKAMKKKGVPVDRRVVFIHIGA